MTVLSRSFRVLVYKRRVRFLTLRYKYKKICDYSIIKLLTNFSDFVIFRKNWTPVNYMKINNKLYDRYNNMCHVQILSQLSVTPKGRRYRIHYYYSYWVLQIKLPDLTVQLLTYNT